MESVIIDIDKGTEKPNVATGEHGGRAFDSKNPLIKHMSNHLSAFFTNPSFYKDDYADAFLMYLGEDMDIRIPQGKIRGYQNTCSTPCEVIERCLNDLFMKLRQHKPGCTENDLRSHINWFITYEEGYIDKRIARVAKAEPYNGMVIPDGTTQNNWSRVARNFSGSVHTSQLENATIKLAKLITFMETSMIFYLQQNNLVATSHQELNKSFSLPYF